MSSILKKISLVCIVGWSVVPYKEWSRMLLGTEGFNLGDVVILLVLLPGAIVIYRNRGKDMLYMGVLLLWLSCALSILKGVVAGDDIRDMLRLVRGVSFWAVIPLVMEAATSETRMRKLLAAIGLVLVLVGVTIPVFSLFPNLAPTNDDMVLVRDEWFGGFQRIFHLGMWGVFPGAIVAMGIGFYDDKWRTVGKATAILLVGCLLFTFVRTFFVVILLAFVAFLFPNWKRTLRAFLRPGTLILFFLTAWGVVYFLTDIVTAAGDRIVNLMSVDLSNVDPGDSEGLGTVVWRVVEAESALDQMESTADHVLGVVGREYPLPDGYSASMPHISFIGIIYSNGLLGAAVYGFFLAYASYRVVQNIKKTKYTRLAFVTIAASGAWFGMLLGGFMAPVFQFPYGVLSMALSVGVSESGARIVSHYQGGVNASA